MVLPSLILSLTHAGIYRYSEHLATIERSRSARCRAGDCKGFPSGADPVKGEKKKERAGLGLQYSKC